MSRWGLNRSVESLELTLLLLLTTAGAIFGRLRSDDLSRLFFYSLPSPRASPFSSGGPLYRLSAVPWVPAAPCSRHGTRLPSYACVPVERPLDGPTRGIGVVSQLPRDTYSSSHFKGIPIRLMNARSDSTGIRRSPC